MDFWSLWSNAGISIGNGDKVAGGRKQKSIWILENQITTSLNKELKDGELFVKLANVIFSAVDVKALKFRDHTDFKIKNESKLKF
jgi:hypothetical protein